MKISDLELAHKVTCPDFEDMEGERFSEWQRRVLVPGFNEMQVRKMQNDVSFLERHLMKETRIRFYKSAPNKKKNLKAKAYTDHCVNRYYHYFKGAFWFRYKPLAVSFPYDTSILPLEHNIYGNIDLILKTTYGITYVNYVFTSDSKNYQTQYQLEATRLQIGARCIKLLTGIEPKTLCLLGFTNKSLFNRYFQYLDLPYEEHLKVLDSKLLPLKRVYSGLCNTCKVPRCAPWKAKEIAIL